MEMVDDLGLIRAELADAFENESYAAYAQSGLALGGPARVLDFLQTLAAATQGPAEQQVGCYVAHVHERHLYFMHCTCFFYASMYHTILLDECIASPG